MSVRIRGKKREEIINNWLEGKDNDEYDVIPTKNEGKYIIKHKVKNNKIEINNSETNNSEESIPEETIPEETIPEPIPESNNVKQKTKPKQIEMKNNDYNTISSEILNQLKNIQSSFNELNEERRRKQEKKAKKKEMKHIIHKEFAKNRVMVEESDDETEYRNNDPQIVYVEKPAPVRIRRRLNLLDRFK